MNKVRQQLKAIIQAYKEDQEFYEESTKNDIIMTVNAYMQFLNMIQTSHLDKDEKRDLLRILGKSPASFNRRHITVKLTLMAVLEPLQNDPNQN